MPTRSMLGIVAIALLAAACSDSGTATPSSSTSPGTTMVAAASTPAVTDPKPTTTSTTSTTEPPVTSPPETTEPENVPGTDGPSDEAAAVLLALNASDATFDAAVTDPNNADSEAALADYHAGEVLQGATELLADYRARGLAERTNPDEPSRSELLSGPKFVDADTAEVAVCFINSNILVLLTPDGPTDINDDIISVRQDLIFKHYAEGWKVTEANSVAEFEGQVGCDE